MGLEAVTNISDFNSANPVGTDPKSEGDDHIRNIKSGILTSFPNITGPMTASHTELNVLDGVTAGTVSASSGVVVDASSKVDVWNVDNLVLNTNTLSATTGNVIISPALDVDNININGNTIISSDAAGDINITPDTTGDLVLDGLKWPQADGTANQVIETDGAGQLSFVTASSFTLVSQVDAEAGTATDERVWSAQRVKQSIDALGSIGQHTIVIPAGAMISATTNGAAVGKAETSTHKVMYQTLDFDQTTEEFAHWSINMPKSWDGGTLLMQPIWSHAAATSFGVTWGFEAVSLGDGDALDSVWGTEVTSDDTGGTTRDLYLGPEVAMTVANAAAEETVFFRITRVVGDVNDDLDADASLHEVRIHYTTDTANDD
jgi:hypothetical protein